MTADFFIIDGSVRLPIIIFEIYLILFKLPCSVKLIIQVVALFIQNYIYLVLYKSGLSSKPVTAQMLMQGKLSFVDFWASTRRRRCQSQFRIFGHIIPRVCLFVPFCPELRRVK